MSIQNRRAFQGHGSHLGLPWPIITFICLLLFIYFSVLTMQGLQGGGHLLFFGFILLLSSTLFWFKDAVSKSRVIAYESLFTTSRLPIIGSILIISVTLSLIRVAFYALGLNSIMLSLTLSFIYIIMIIFINGIHNNFESIFTFKNVMSGVCTMVLCNFVVMLFSASAASLLCVINHDIYILLLSHVWSFANSNCFLYDDELSIAKARRSVKFRKYADFYMGCSRALDQERRLFNVILPWLDRSNIALYDSFSEWHNLRKVGDVVNQEKALFFYTQHRFLFEDLHIRDSSRRTILHEVYMLRYYNRIYK